MRPGQRYSGSRIYLVREPEVGGFAGQFSSFLSFAWFFGKEEAGGASLEFRYFLVFLLRFSVPSLAMRLADK
jgi:hypothetical protein